jgi:hypothetical protein
LRADQVPEQAFAVEPPVQVPDPELPDSTPEPLALRPPPLTLTVTEPLPPTDPDTLTGMYPL